MDVGTFLVGLFTLLFGGALCFAGLRFFRILLPIWGFVAGFWIGEALIAAIFGDSNTAIIAGWVVGLIGGLVLAALAYWIYRAALAILGAGFGLWLFAALLTWIGLESNLLVAILAIFGAILFAILALQDTLGKYLTIALTALLGATGIIVGLLFLIGPLTVENFRAGLAPLLPSVLQESWLAALLWLLLAVLGGLIQWLTTRGSEDTEEPEDELGDEPVEEDVDIGETVIET